MHTLNTSISVINERDLWVPKAPKGFIHLGGDVIGRPWHGRPSMLAAALLPSIVLPPLVWLMTKDHCRYEFSCFAHTSILLWGNDISGV